MKILFLHGWQSTPGGLKPTCLNNHGHAVLNPALPDDDFDAAVRIAQAEYDGVYEGQGDRFVFGVHESEDREVAERIARHMMAYHEADHFDRVVR